METKNLTDVTDLSDNALDVVLAVKSGEECVTVEHLTPTERFAVCRALDVNARNHWIVGAPYEPRIKSRFVVRDVEGLILDRQDAEQNDE